MKKKILSLLLAGAMVFSASAVTALAEEASSDSDFVIAIEGTVQSMDPQNISDTNSISATRGVYETLVTLDENQEIVGQLADSWEVSEDGLTYTFHLKEGVKFHDGTDFNSEAVLANFERVLDVENPIRSTSTYYTTDEDGNQVPRIESIDNPDDYTVVMTLVQPWGILLNRLTQMCFISPAAIEEYGNDVMYHPCGTGPFICEEGGWVEGDHVTMVRNEDYWGEKPGITSVTITEVPEAGTRTAMLQTGEADMVYPVTSDQIPAVEGIEGVTLTSGESNIMRYVTLNTNIAGLDDVNVRQALNYAIDKDAYVEVMYGGYGEAATSVVPKVIQYYESQKAYDYDQDRARTMLEEAGYGEDNPLSLTLWGDNTSQEIKAMTFIEQQLEAVGVQVEVVPMEPATVSENIYVDFEDAQVNMWYVNWSASDFSTDSSMRNLLHSSMIPPTSANAAYYDNLNFDEALDSGLAATDEEEQKEFYQTAQEIAWSDAPWLFLGTDQIVYAVTDSASGAYVTPDGTIRYQNVTVTE